jgi:hypothetical protein
MDPAAPVITVGGKKIIASGVVVVLPGEAVEITPLPGIVSPRVRVVFEKQNGAAYRMEGKVDGDLLTLYLYNFNNPIGISPLQPMLIGKAEDRIIWMSYIVHAVGSDAAATRLFSYTISSSPASEAVPA